MLCKVLVLKIICDVFRFFCKKVFNKCIFLVYKGKVCLYNYFKWDLSFILLYMGMEEVEFKGR